MYLLRRDQQCAPPLPATAAAAAMQPGRRCHRCELAVWPIHSVTMLARFFSSEPRRPKSLLCGTKFHLQRAQEALSVEHLVASTDIFYGSFPEVAPDARRHAMRAATAPFQKYQFNI